MAPRPNEEDPSMLTSSLSEFDASNDNDEEINEDNIDDDIDADAIDQIMSSGDNDQLISEAEEEEEDEEQLTSLSQLETVHMKNDDLSYEDEERMVDEDDQEEVVDDEDEHEVEDDEHEDDEKIALDSSGECNGPNADEIEDEDGEDEEEVTENEDKTDIETDEDGGGDSKRRKKGELTDNDQSPIEKASPIRSRRPSRNCRPNSLIFNADTTSLSPVTRKRGRGRPPSLGKKKDGTPLTSTPAGKTAAIDRKSKIKNLRQSTTTRARNGYRTSIKSEPVTAEQPPASTTNMSGRPVRMASRRTSYQDMVKKAVSTVLSSNRAAQNGKNNPALYTLDGRLKKRMGRPRKHPYPGADGQMVMPPPKTLSPAKVNKVAYTSKLSHVTSKVAKVHPPGHKKGQSPPVKLSPFLAAILSGQSLGETKNGRPKGRPRVLPTLDEAVLNGSTASGVPGVDTSGTTDRRSLRRCDCEAKYRKILVNLEESLESKFAESTHKVSLNHDHICDVY